MNTPWMRRCPTITGTTEIQFAAIFDAGGIFSMPSQEEQYVTAPLLRIGEAARYLGVGRKIVYQLLEWGELRAVKGKGSVVLIEKRSLDDLRSSGRLT
jgi:excisionase family DNA binding protein